MRPRDEEMLMAAADVKFLTKPTHTPASTGHILFKYNTIAVLLLLSCKKRGRWGGLYQSSWYKCITVDLLASSDGTGIYLSAVNQQEYFPKCQANDLKQITRVKLTCRGHINFPFPS